MNKKLTLIFLSVAFHAGADSLRQIVAVGRVEAVDGEIEVAAQLSGTLKVLHVREGDEVKAGTVLAEVDAPREKAALELARANLARVRVGNGKEEIAAAQAEHEAAAHELHLAQLEHERAMNLRSMSEKAIADDLLDQRREQVEILGARLRAVSMRHAALQRGPLAEDVAAAEAEVAAAGAVYDMRLVRALRSGRILHVHKHAGDFVSLNFPSPILRMADTGKLRVRLEVGETDTPFVREGLQGTFTPHGSPSHGGRLRVERVLPAFAPRRLFEPDSTARMDTRTLQVLCEITQHDAPLYLGQRVMARLDRNE